MRAPEFWASDGALAHLLQPLAFAWTVGARLRRRLARPARPAVPVVCVGNAVAGGAGKTPTALAVAALVPDRRPHFLTRGYGGRVAGPHRVDRSRDDSRTVGDEALLLAAAAPTWVAHDRVAGAAAAAAAGAGLVVMDDGFQNPSLEKALSLLVVDGAYGFGNGRVMPAGPLREPLGDALARADAVVLVGADRASVLARVGRIPVLAGRLVPEPEAIRFRGRELVAFAGIGRPAKFFATLRELGAKVRAAEAFPDHHRYTEDEVMRLVEAAAALGGRPVTTAKDFVRLPAGARAMVDVLEVTLEWDDPTEVAGLLARV